MTHYQNVIIGFGKAGKTLATHLSEKNETVALIEKSQGMYGGTCINVACIPTKALVFSAEQVKHQDLSFKEKVAHYKKAIQEKNEITETLRQANYNKVNDANVTIIDGVASFVDNTTLLVNDEHIKADKIYINTGSTPYIPEVFRHTAYYTSETIMELTELPEHLTIIGAGYIGLEFASMYHNFGSKVSVVSNSNDFMPKEDFEVAQKVFQHMKAIGIDFYFESTVTDLSDGEVIINNDTVIKSDAVLIATGRLPNTSQLKMEKTDVEMDRAAVKVDNKLKTTVDHIYALGDVKGGLQFTYISLDDYRIITTHERTTDNRGDIPYTVFIDPPLSRVGLTEQEITSDIKVAKMPVATIPKTHILRNKAGFLKVIVEAQTDLILGAHLFCEDSFEIINIIRLAMQTKTPYQVLRDAIYTHPSMSEALNELLNTIV
ncbi:MAG TPA: FAD-dependent oxidoreductase [Erysipelothrix sp.]|nr:FAD-dependent oxidoreductase [Erysipelothrix sp.]